MIPIRTYVETSVWSCAFAEDTPDFRLETLAFFDRCRAGLVVPVISAVVLVELDRAPEPLRTGLARVVAELNPEIVEATSVAEALAQEFVKQRVVPPSKPEDARHVATAFAAQLDVLVSWNFRHMASVRRADAFNAVALREGFLKPLRIISPSEVGYDDAS